MTLLFNCTGDVHVCALDIFTFIVGIVSGILVWGRLIPQIIKGCKNRSMADFSYKFLGLGIASHGLLFVYGGLRLDVPLMINAPLALIGMIILTIMKKCYKENESESGNKECVIEIKNLNSKP